jgi:archaellum biogenesis ATPase FlaH
VQIKKIVHDMEHRFLPHTAQLQGRKSGVVVVSDIIAAIHAGTGQKFIDDDWLDIDGHTPIFGRTKLYINDDNSIVLHSFKNGGTSYTLLSDTSKFDESEFLNNTAAKPESDFWHYGNHNANKAADPTSLKTLFNISKKGSAAVLREQMLTDSFVLDGIAITGHITVIYAKPNTGKTLLVLKMLKDSIDAGRIAPEKVVYINADDNFNGYVTKLEFAEQAGFNMVAPSIDDFSAKELLFLLQNMITDKSAHGAVVVLDTLKKFTDLMDKKTGSNFMAIARAFSLAGGTMILLAHTNKNRNKDGKAVFGGTSDIVDDCDGAFILDEVTQTEDIKTVLFEKIKARGNVEENVTFFYSSNPTDYIDLIESVTRGDAAQATKAKSFINKLSDKPAIDAIFQCLANGVHKRTDILRMNHEGGVSRRTVEKCLNDYTNDLWECKIGENNSKIYYKTNSKTDHLPF